MHERFEAPLNFFGKTSDRKTSDYECYGPEQIGPNVLLVEVLQQVANPFTSEWNWLQKKMKVIGGSIKRTHR